MCKFHIDASLQRRERAIESTPFFASKSRKPYFAIKIQLKKRWRQSTQNMQSCFAPYIWDLVNLSARATRALQRKSIRKSCRTSKKNHVPQKKINRNSQREAEYADSKGKWNANRPNSRRQYAILESTGFADWRAAARRDWSKSLLVGLAGRKALSEKFELDIGSMWYFVRIWKKKKNRLFNRRPCFEVRSCLRNFRKKCRPHLHIAQSLSKLDFTVLWCCNI